MLLREDGDAKFILTYGTLIFVEGLNILSQLDCVPIVTANIICIFAIVGLSSVTLFLSPLCPHPFVLGIRDAKTSPADDQQIHTGSGTGNTKHVKGSALLVGNKSGDLRNTLRSQTNEMVDTQTAPTFETNNETQSRASFENSQLGEGKDSLEGTLDNGNPSSSEGGTLKINVESVYVPPSEYTPSSPKSQVSSDSEYSGSQNGNAFPVTFRKASVGEDLSKVVLPTGLSYDFLYQGASRDSYTLDELQKLDNACLLLDSIRRTNLEEVQFSKSSNIALYQTVSDVSRVVDEVKHAWWSSKPSKLNIGSAYIEVPPSYVLAFLLDYMNPRRVEFNKDDIKRLLVSRKNCHTMTTFNRRWMPVPFLYRDFLTRHTWKRLDKDRILYCTYNDTDNPYPLPEMKNESKGVRPHFFCAILIENSAQGKSPAIPEIFQNSIVTMFIDIEAGGSISQHLRQYACVRSMTILGDIEKYFKSTSQEVEKCREECKERFANILFKYNLSSINATLVRPNMHERNEIEKNTVDPSVWNNFGVWLSTSVPWLDADKAGGDKTSLSGTLYRPSLTSDGSIFGAIFKDDFAEKQFRLFSTASWCEKLETDSQFLMRTILISSFWTTIVVYLCSQHEGQNYGSAENETGEKRGSWSQPGSVVVVLFCHLFIGAIPAYMLSKVGSYLQAKLPPHTHYSAAVILTGVLATLPFVLVLTIIRIFTPYLSNIMAAKSTMFPAALILSGIFRITFAMPLHLLRRIAAIYVLLACTIVPHYQAINKVKDWDERWPIIVQVGLQGMSCCLVLCFMFSNSAASEVNKRHLFTVYWLEYRHKYMHERHQQKNSSTVDNNSLKKVLSQLNTPEVRIQLAKLLEIQVEYKQLKYLNEIGKGGNGVVFAATYRNQVVAVKQLIGSQRLSESSIMSFIGEMQFGVMLQHKNIVKTIACVLKFPYICCVLEYAREGSLKEFMSKEMLLDWETGKQSLSIDICHGMRYLHERQQPIIHRDLKTTNVLITEWRSAKISDFGSSRLLPENSEELTFDVGTALYAPPEALKGDTYGTFSDVYSFGCILADLAMHGNVTKLYYMGDDAPKNQFELTEMVARGWRPKLPDSWREDIPVICNIIEACWKQDQFDRPSFKTIERNISSWDGQILNKDLNSAVAHASVYSIAEENFINEGYTYVLAGLRKVKQVSMRNAGRKATFQKSGPDENKRELALDLEFSNPGIIGIHGATIPYKADVVANFIVQIDHPFRRIIRRMNGTEKLRSTTHRENEHNSIIQLVTIFPPPMKNREFVVRFVWKRISQGVYLMWGKSVEHPSCPLNESQRVRARAHTGILIQDIPGTNSCRVTNRFEVMDLFGSKGNYIPNMLGSLASHKEGICQYFWEVEAFLNREHKRPDVFPEGSQENRKKYLELFDKAYKKYVNAVPQNQRKQERIEKSEKEEDTEESMSSEGNAHGSGTRPPLQSGVKAALDKLANTIRTGSPEYSYGECQQIQKGKDFYRKCKDLKNAKALKSHDGNVVMQSVHMGEESIMCLLARTVVDASADLCIAYRILCYESKEEKRKKHFLRATVKHINDHSFYYISKRSIGFPFNPREARSKVVWRKEEDGKVVIDVSDTKDLMEEYPLDEGSVLASVHSVWMFEPLKPIGEIPQTAVSFVSRVDPGGNIPTKLVNHLGKRFLSPVSDLRKMFDQTNGNVTFDRTKVRKDTAAAGGAAAGKEAPYDDDKPWLALPDQQARRRTRSGESQLIFGKNTYLKELPSDLEKKVEGDDLV